MKTFKLFEIDGIKKGENKPHFFNGDWSIAGFQGFYTAEAISSLKIIMVKVDSKPRKLNFDKL